MRAIEKCSLLCMILLLASISAQAAEQDILQSPVWQEKVSFEIRDTLLGLVLDDLVKPTGTNYTIDPGLRFIKAPNLGVTEAPRAMALKTVAKIAGINYKIADNTIVFEAKPGTMNVWQKHVTVVVTDTKLSDVLPGLFKSVGVGLILDPSAANLIVKSLDLTDVPFAEALYKILDQAGAVYNGGDVIHIMSKKASSEPAAPVTSEVDVADPLSPHVTVIKSEKTADPWKRLVNVDVKDAALRDVVDELFRFTGLNYAIEPNAGRLAVNSLKLTDASFSEALDNVMKITGAKYSKVQGAVVLIEATPLAAEVDKVVNLDVKDMSLVDVMDLFFKDTGISYTIDSNVKQLRVTATLTNAPFVTALESLIKAAGLAYRIDKGVYRISRIPNVTPAQGTANTTKFAPPEQSSVQPDSSARKINLHVDVEAIHPAKGKVKEKRILMSPAVTVFEGQKATVTISNEIPPSAGMSKQLISLVSVSIVATIWAEDQINISGIIDYVQDEYSAHNVRILATLKPGKPQKLPVISIPSTKDKSKAVINLTLTATLADQK